MHLPLFFSALLCDGRYVEDVQLFGEKVKKLESFLDSRNSLASLLLAADHLALSLRANKLRHLFRVGTVRSSGSRSRASAAHSSQVSGLQVDRQISVPTKSFAQQGWLDITADVAACLPLLPYAMATVSCPEGNHCSLVLLDPRILDVGPLEAVVPERNIAVSLGVRKGTLLLPADARLMLLMEKEAALGHYEDGLVIPLDIRIEATESLLTLTDGPSGSVMIAQAALRAALLASGVNSTVVAALEAAPEQTPVNRVYESFVTRTHRPEELIQAARRASHHINHLLRQDAAQAAAYLRNNDAARNKSDISLSQPRQPLYLVLDNVRSAFNVGSIFRSADTARCAEVITCGFTPHPPNPKLAKTAFGAIQAVPTRHEESTLHVVRSLQARGIKVYAMETTELSQNYCKVDFPSVGVALVLGNEEIGVDTRVMSLVDGLVEIPTFGSKNSLNVASAASIVAFEVLRQWGKLG